MRAITEVGLFEGEADLIEGPSLMQEVEVRNSKDGDISHQPLSENIKSD